MIAGPSEITVLADKKSEIKHIVTSLIGQAEHDPKAQCIMISKDLKSIKKKSKKINSELKKFTKKKNC